MNKQPYSGGIYWEKKYGQNRDINEETSTLLEYDIVDLDRALQQELRDSIHREGKVIYEKI